MQTAPENTSGQGSSAAIPDEIKGWNWGAFSFGWIWGISNKVWISLLSAIPFVGVIVLIVLGIKGSEWAWRHKKWVDAEDFNTVQRAWGIAAAVVFVLDVIIIILTAPAEVVIRGLIAGLLVIYGIGFLIVIGVKVAIKTVREAKKFQPPED